VPGEAAVFKAGKATFVFNSRVNWPEEESFTIKLAGAQAKGKLGLNGWITVLDEDTEGAHLWFSARKGARLVMDLDRAIFWRPLVDEESSAASGQALKSAAAMASAWSGPVRHLNIAADQRPWNIVVRLSPGKP
jgi:hypothetical protein